MPTYAFRCEKCGHEYEELVLQFGQIAPCPKCGSPDAERLMSAPPVQSRSRSLRPRTGGCGPVPGSPFG